MAAAVAEEALGTIIVEAVESVGGEGAASSVEEVLSAEGRFAVENAVGAAEAEAIASAEEAAAARSAGEVDVSTPEPGGMSWFKRAGQTFDDVRGFAGKATVASAATGVAAATFFGTADQIITGTKKVASELGGLLPDFGDELGGKVDVGIQRAIDIETKFAVGLGAVVVLWALFNR